ncbi:hypothetical protein AVEN_86204-1 [Araneus ventricosus]|uniref:Tc1-like transposase DDE domain-containing protein n=1 Tax=Araneus ventricosus TaxID=182803 RepID=A0A4Y2JL93_ARAVE|nr:hypothetical protein AVEN_86204-1 [Araneus ventricosus]
MHGFAIGMQRTGYPGRKFRRISMTGASVIGPPTNVKKKFKGGVPSQTLPLSTNSPDMNIIELIWVALQCAVQKRSPPPGTPIDLRTALQDSWWEKPPGYLQTLDDTMPRRVASLLCARVG